jgi:hypothetical protein
VRRLDFVVERDIGEREKLGPHHYSCVLSAESGSSQPWVTHDISQIVGCVPESTVHMMILRKLQGNTSLGLDEVMKLPRHYYTRKPNHMQSLGEMPHELPFLALLHDQRSTLCHTYTRCL